jgi:hypothetical protein
MKPSIKNNADKTLALAPRECQEKHYKYNSEVEELLFKRTPPSN